MRLARIRRLAQRKQTSRCPVVQRLKMLVVLDEDDVDQALGDEGSESDVWPNKRLQRGLQKFFSSEDISEEEVQPRDLSSELDASAAAAADAAGAVGTAAFSELDASAADADAAGGLGTAGPPGLDASAAAADAVAAVVTAGFAELGASAGAADAARAAGIAGANASTTPAVGFPDAQWHSAVRMWLAADAAGFHEEGLCLEIARVPWFIHTCVGESVRCLWLGCNEVGDVPSGLHRRQWTLVLRTLFL